MAKRPIAEKKMRKLKRALRKGRIPTKIDLVAWLKLHRYAQTSGAARRLLEEGKVKVDSHIVGRERRIQVGSDGQPVLDDNAKPKLVWVAAPLVRSDWRERLTVSA